MPKRTIEGEAEFNRRLREGDSSAWKDFHREQRKRVRRRANRFGYPDPAVDVDDAEQNAWLNLYRKRSSIRDDMPVEALVDVIALRKAQDQLTVAGRRSRRGLHESDTVKIERSNSQGPEDIVLDREAFSRLTQQVREIVGVAEQADALLLRAEGYSLTEIGRAQGKGPKSADNRLQHARNKLREQEEALRRGA